MGHRETARACARHVNDALTVGADRILFAVGHPHAVSTDNALRLLGL